MDNYVLQVSTDCKCAVPKKKVKKKLFASLLIDLPDRIAGGDAGHAASLGVTTRTWIGDDHERPTLVRC